MDPPPYSDHDPVDADVVSPTTYYMSDKFIFSDKSPTDPAFELSHQVLYLHETTRNVTISRLDGELSPGQVMVTHKRHIYNLRHPALITAPVFLFHADAVSRLSLCSFGLSTFRSRFFSSRTGYRVHRALKDHRGRHTLPRGELFCAKPVRKGTVTYEWLRLGHELVARELESSSSSSSSSSSRGQSLFISKEMDVRTRDALVSAWVMKVWWEASNSPHHEPWFLV